jgi:hypothetical protein
METTVMAEVKRTILVPIDLHGINRGALETLVRIARQMDRGLLGLLLEDIRLQRVADLPFTTEITLSGGRERSLLRDHLTQRQSQVSIATRRLLHELAERDRIPLHFEEAEGTRWHTALEKEGELDIFFPARQRWHGHRAVRGEFPIRRLGILLTDTERDQQILEAASLLLKAGLVGDSYILCRRPPLPEQLHALYQQGHQVRIQSSISASPADVARLIQQSAFDLLLLSRESLIGIPAQILDAALEKSGSQVLVVN